MDGGKDSLSMAAKTEENEVVKSPGQICISVYSMVPDINLKVTPDFKILSDEVDLLVYVNASSSTRKLYNQR